MSEYANGVEKGFGDIGMVLWGPCKDEVFIGGTTHSMNTSSGLCPVPVTTTSGSYQPTRAGGGDMPYIIKFKPKVTTDFTTSSASCGTTVNFTDNSNGSCIWGSAVWSPSNWTWDFGDGQTSTLQNPVNTYSASGTYSVKLVISCPKDSITKSITVNAAPFTVSTSTVAPTCSSGGSATATPSTGGTYTYLWSNAATGQTASNLTGATYTVTVTNSSNCTVTATAIVPSAGTTFSVTTSSVAGSCTAG